MENLGKYKFDCFKKVLSQESFTDFFDHYFTRLVQFAFTISKSELLAEEIVLDVFTKLWKQRSKLETINNIETYLFISVRNTALNTLRHENKFHFNMLEDCHVQLADYKTTADTSLIEEELLSILSHSVNQLPAKCKIVFKLIREDGLNRNEVAHILNISVKTVDNQIAIAIKKIAEKLNIDLSEPNKSIRLRNFLLSL